MQSIDPLTRWHNHVGDEMFKQYKPKFDEFMRLNAVGDPAELLKLTVIDASDLAEEFYKAKLRDGCSSGTASNYYVAVRSFFSHNGLRLGKIQKSMAVRPEYTADTVLSQRQYFDLITAVRGDRDKGAVGILFGGQRDGLVCALKLKYIETRDWENARVVVFSIPEFAPDAKGCNVNKNRMKYRFAVLDDVMVYVKRHLDERRAAGEVFTPESWLFRTRRNGKLGRSSFADSSNIQPITQCWVNRVVVEAAKRIGIQSFKVTRFGKKRAQVHGHSGRPYAKTQMRKAGIDPDLREFLIGHKVKMNGAYDKFSADEITKVYEGAREHLAVLPEPVSEMRTIKNSLQAKIDELKGRMSAEQFEALKLEILKADTVADIESKIAQVKIQ